MSKLQKSKATESDWKRIGPCLVRYKAGKYYALVKRRGKQIRYCLKTTDLELARRRLTDYLADLQKLDLEIGRLTLDGLKERFYATLSGSESTIYKTRLAIDNMIDGWPVDAPRTLDRIKTAHCKTWLAKLQHLANATVNDRITAARDFFAMAVDLGAIVRNPMDGIKYRKRVKPIRNTPSEEQFRAIVADIRAQKVNRHGQDDSADFVELAGVLGLGQAELSGIRRQDIDLEAGIIRVFRRKTQQQFTVPIFPDARNIIERRLADMPDAPEARLLPQDNCRKALASACRRLKFQRFEPRSLRRYHITRSLRAGIDAPTVASWQGHQDGGELVLRTYQAEVSLAHSLKMAAMLGPKPENVVEMPKAARVEA
jgi:integrase